jgi:uncharacterized Zn-finger protein
MSDAPETLEIETTTVACDGGTKLGHPEVYLNMGDAREIQCPYCSRLYVLKAGAKVGAGH